VALLLHRVAARGAGPHPADRPGDLLRPHLVAAPRERAADRHGPALVRDARPLRVARRGVARSVGLRGPGRERLACAHHGTREGGPGGRARCRRPRVVGRPPHLGGPAAPERTGRVRAPGGEPDGDRGWAARPRLLHRQRPDRGVPPGARRRRAVGDVRGPRGEPPRPLRHRGGRARQRALRRPPRPDARRALGDDGVRERARRRPVRGRDRRPGARGRDAALPEDRAPGLGGAGRAPGPLRRPGRVPRPDGGCARSATAATRRRSRRGPRRSGRRRGSWACRRTRRAQGRRRRARPAGARA